LKLLKGAEPPQSRQKSSNRFRNLTELSPLFYIICLAVMFIGRTDVNFIVLVWSYVALRWHSLIRLTVTKCRRAFVAGNIVLLIMWVRLALML
jgi:hypothetical protein